MPDTKPGVTINNDGLCQACVRYEMRRDVDWNGRFNQLKELTSKYKRTDGGYDSIIAVSGGKDSHYQVYVLKELLGMNPLLVTVSDPFTHTEAGKHNIRNLQEAFNCNLITFDLSPNLAKRMMRMAFEHLGSPTWPIDRPIYAFPIRAAVNFRIPLVVYGENVSWEYGGVLQKETYSAKEQINNDVAKKVDFSLWTNNGITADELAAFQYPTEQEVQRAELEPIYLSYFIPWDGYRNYQIAKRYGFKDLQHEWKRDGYIEDYDQVDSIAYLMNVWMKYPKFGFARVTDVVGYWIRSGKISREEGRKLIVENDHKLDRRILDDFLNFTGYSHKEFWSIVDKFWNMDLFEKTETGYKIKAHCLP